MDIEWIALNFILAISSLISLQARKFTILYPLFILSALAYVLSAIFSDLFYFLIASSALYFVTVDCIRNGYLSDPETDAIFFEKKILLAWIFVAIAAIPVANLSLYLIMLSAFFLSQTFAITGVSRKNSFLRSGDYEAMLIASCLILFMALSFALKPQKLAEILGFYSIYTASILYLLTRIRY